MLVTLNIADLHVTKHEIAMNDWKSSNYKFWSAIGRIYLLSLSLPLSLFLFLFLFLSCFIEAHIFIMLNFTSIGNDTNSSQFYDLNAINYSNRLNNKIGIMRAVQFIVNQRHTVYAFPAFSEFYTGKFAFILLNSLIGILFWSESKSFLELFS